VASLKQVLFGCKELVLGEGRVELASHLLVTRGYEPDRAALTLQSVYGLQDQPSELLGLETHPPNTLLYQDRGSAPS
jgi:hypothetical protein